LTRCSRPDVFKSFRGWSEDAHKKARGNSAVPETTGPFFRAYALG
jgi:hypothetical protein